MTLTAFADGDVIAAPNDATPLINALRTLAKVVVDTLIAVAAILMVVGVATGFVTGQLMTTPWPHQSARHHKSGPPAGTKRPARWP